jgi:hypothetical protein
MADTLANMRVNGVLHSLLLRTLLLRVITQIMCQPMHCRSQAKNNVCSTENLSFSTCAIIQTSKFSRAG